MEHNIDPRTDITQLNLTKMKDMFKIHKGLVSKTLRTNLIKLKSITENEESIDPDELSNEGL